MREYFLKPFRSFGINVNVKVDLSNYALKANLANLNTEVDELDLYKLASVPADLSKLSDVVKNDVKKTVYDKLVAKVNNFDTSDFVLKTRYQTDKTELENKIPYLTDFVKKAKLNQLENKIPDVSSLGTKTSLTAVENKIPSVSNLVKKQTITLKLQKLKINLTIKLMTNILQLQSLRNQLQMFLMIDLHKPI